MGRGSEKKPGIVKMKDLIIPVPKAGDEQSGEVPTVAIAELQRVMKFLRRA